jgi:hypothetical protein
VTESEARDIKNRHSSELLSMEGVVGVGVGKDNNGYVLNVFLDGGGEPPILPQEVEGLPVCVQTSGRFVKQ